MIPKSWQAVPASGQIRLGGAHDGGYVVPAQAVDTVDLLISMGLNVDWGFEEDLRRRRPQCRVVCFDHTVDSRFWARVTVGHIIHRRIRDIPMYLRYRKFFSTPEVAHRQVAIGYDGAGSTSLTSILAGTSGTETVALKIDIEGWEYRILDQVVAAKDRVAFLVIEFHDLDLQRERVDAFVRAMTGFTITWIHANNFAGADPNGDPLVIEMTMVANRFVTHGGDPAHVQSLTSRNNTQAPELELVFG